MKIRSTLDLPLCSNHTGFSLPESMTSATRMVADDSLVWDMVAIACKLSDDNQGLSRDIMVGAVQRCRCSHLRTFSIKYCGFLPFENVFEEGGKACGIVLVYLAFRGRIADR